MCTFILKDFGAILGSGVENLDEFNKIWYQPYKKSHIHFIYGHKWPFIKKKGLQHCMSYLQTQP